MASVIKPSLMLPGEGFMSKPDPTAFALSLYVFIQIKNLIETSFGFKSIKTIRALLTETCLYLVASGEDGIFEINMTASEFTDTGEFLKYDPQDGGWEEPM